jgi:hypothetical protein
MKNLIKGYSLPWANEPSDLIMEEGEYLYPEGMIERVVYIDKEQIIFEFSEPLTKQQIKEYEPMILDESKGYKLIY